MSKIKEYLLGVFSVISIVFFIIFRLNKKNDNFSDLKTRSDALKSENEILLKSAEKLDKESDLIDNTSIEEDEEWHKKR